MCMEDLAIARRTYHKVTNASGGIVQLAANPSRIGVIVGPTIVSDPVLVYLNQGQSTIPASLGIVYGSSSAAASPSVSTGFLSLNYRDHGAVVMESLRMQSAGGAAFNVVEILLQDGLANELAKFLRDKGW